MAELSEVVEFLDDYLSIDAIEDYPGAWNGLQVSCRVPVERICAATDACQATIEGAAAAGAQFLLAHHGLFWSDPLPLTGRAYRRVRALVEADLAVYAAHLPLDVHPVVGNNVLLAQALELDVEGRFGKIRSVEGLGVWSATDLSLNALMVRVEAACGCAPRLIGGGPTHVRRVGIVSGGGGAMLFQAAKAGLDTLITGEGNHHTYHDALECGLNLIYAGHYATETFGVRELARVVGERFDVEWDFLDQPTGL